MSWCLGCITKAWAREGQVFLRPVIAKMRTEHFKRRESRRFIVRRRMRWLAALVLVLALPCAVDWFVSPRHHAAASMQSISSGNSGVDAHSDPLLASKGILPFAVQAEPSREVVNPFPVMPGGIQCIEELKNSTAKDPVVSPHYAAFWLANARIVQLDRERAIHYSSRRGDQIYWKQRELLLAKDEIPIADRAQTVLIHCGSPIAEAMVASIFPNGPTELNTPGPIPYMPGDLESDDRFPEIQLAAGPNVPPPGTNLYSGGGTGPGTFLPSGPVGPIPYPAGPATPPVVATPEPGTAILLLMGLLALLFVQKRKPKDAPKIVT